jgi:hypothetical protein
VKEWQDGAHRVVHDPAALAQPRAELFDAAYWERAGLIEGRAAGRGAVVFVRGGVQGESWALRHYRRGGWARRLIEDSYLWLGLAQTRPWREFRLTHELHARGLPVPRPVARPAARYFLHGRPDHRPPGRNRAIGRPAAGRTAAARALEPARPPAAALP